MTVAGPGAPPRRRMTALRQFQVLGLAYLAVFAWIALYISAARYVLPRGDLAGTLGDLTGGGLGERWYSFVVAALAWGHVPVVYALTAWGVVLAAGSIRTAGRGTYDAGRVPTPLLFWGSVALGGLSRSIAGLTAGAHRFLDSQYYGAAGGAMWLWLAVAAATLLAAAVRALRGRPSEAAVAGRSTRAARLMRASREQRGQR